MDGSWDWEDASGNRVNVGNFDEDGLNVNANHPTNDWNDNLGLLLSQNCQDAKSRSANYG